MPAAALYLYRSRLPRQVTRRGYFVRYLTRYLLEAFGSAPRAMLVAIAGVALQDEKIGDRQVRRPPSARGKGAPPARRRLQPRQGRFPLWISRVASFRETL